MADLAAQLQQMVADEVQRLLGPHIHSLERLSNFLGGGSARRGPGRPKGSVNVRRKPAGKGPAPLHTEASAYKVGEAVTYLQGRGTFQAKVVEVDEKTNTVTVKAEGKKAKVRPADKVYPA
jgi:hypothetical protein